MSVCTVLGLESSIPISNRLADGGQVIMTSELSSAYLRIFSRHEKKHQLGNIGFYFLLLHLVYVADDD